MNNSLQEVTQAAIESTVSYVDDEHGDVQPCITHDDTAIKHAIAMTNNVKKVASAKRGDLFKIKPSILNPKIGYIDQSALGIRLTYIFNYISDINHHGEESRNLLVMNPYLACCSELMCKYEFSYESLSRFLINKGCFEFGSPAEKEARDLVARLVAFVDELHEKINSNKFKKGLANYLRASNKNYRSMMKYLKGLFEQHKRLMIVRIDLGFKKHKGWPDLTPTSVTHKEARDFRTKFLKLLKKSLKKSSLFKHLIGYGLKLEYAFYKGFHFHLIAIFNGSFVREDATWGRLVGELWVEVTNGRGLYFNCNNLSHKKNYKTCGIGTIDRDDFTAMDGLKKAVLYLTKADDFIRVARQGNDRVFFKGQLPRLRSKRGRPRKSAKNSHIALATYA